MEEVRKEKRKTGNLQKISSDGYLTVSRYVVVTLKIILPLTQLEPDGFSTYKPQRRFYGTGSSIPIDYKIIVQQKEKSLEVPQNEKNILY